MAPCSLAVVYIRFGETYFSILGGSIFFRNVGKRLPDYTLSHADDFSLISSSLCNFLHFLITLMLRNLRINKHAAGVLLKTVALRDLLRFHTCSVTNLKMALIT
jgi:hypothetical protein